MENRDTPKQSGGNAGSGMPVIAVNKLKVLGGTVPLKFGTPAYSPGFFVDFRFKVISYNKIYEKNISK